MIFGLHSIIEAIEAGRDIEKIYLKRDFGGELVKTLFAKIKTYGIPCRKVPVEKLNSFTEKNHQGAVGFRCRNIVQQYIGYNTDALRSRQNSSYHRPRRCYRHTQLRSHIPYLRVCRSRRYTVAVVLFGNDKCRCRQDLGRSSALPACMSHRQSVPSHKIPERQRIHRHSPQRKSKYRLHRPRLLVADSIGARCRRPRHKLRSTEPMRQQSKNTGTR